MSRFDVFLWVAVPYVCVAVFVVGHVWRYRAGQYTWTAHSTQLMERRMLRAGSLLFHVGILAVVGGHVLGILVPRTFTARVGVSDDAYHWIAVVMGGLAGVAVSAGLAILLYRRIAVRRVRATTTRSDLVLYPVLVVTILFGMLATFWGSAVDEHLYRETVSPWFRGVFTLRPRGELIADAPFVFQAHAFTAMLLFAIWPFTRLVHVWSVPLGYLGRAPVLYRSRATVRNGHAGSSPSGSPVAAKARAPEPPQRSV